MKKDKDRRTKLSPRRKRRRRKRYNTKLSKGSKTSLKTSKKTSHTKLNTIFSLRRNRKYLKNLKNCLLDTRVKKQERDYWLSQNISWRLWFMRWDKRYKESSFRDMDRRNRFRRLVPLWEKKQLGMNKPVAIMQMITLKNSRSLMIQLKRSRRESLSIGKGKMLRNELLKSLRNIQVLRLKFKRVKNGSLTRKLRP